MEQLSGVESFNLLSVKMGEYQQWRAVPLFLKSFMGGQGS